MVLEVRKVITILEECLYVVYFEGFFNRFKGRV